MVEENETAKAAVTLQPYPCWIKRYIEEAAALLGVCGWECRVEVCPDPGEDRGNDASVAVDAAYRRAHFSVGTDLVAGEHAWYVILHECSHVRLADYEAAYRRIVMLLGREAADLARQTLFDTEETLVEQLSRALARRAAVPYVDAPNEKIATLFHI